MNATFQPTVVLLGNPNPMMQERHPIIEIDGDGQPKLVGWQQRTVPAAHLNQSVTRITMRPEYADVQHVELSLSTRNDRRLSMTADTLGGEHRQYALAVHELEDLLAVHSAGVAPAWVSTSDDRLGRAVAQHFACPVTPLRRGMNGGLIGGPTALISNGGRDAMHHQHLDTAAPPATFTYGAISANTGSGFAATDTTLAGELTTNGLARKQMTFAHTTGTNTSTLTATWTYTGSTTVVVASFANFNAASVGTLGEEDPLNTTGTVAVNGDSVTISYTFTTTP